MLLNNVYILMGYGRLDAFYATVFLRYYGWCIHWWSEIIVEFVHYYMVLQFCLTAYI